MTATTLPMIQFDRKTVIWVACHQDQSGEPLICVDIDGQIVPVATVAGLAAMIDRSGALQSSKGMREIIDAKRNLSRLA